MFGWLDQAKTSPSFVIGWLHTWIMSWFMAGTHVAKSRVPIMTDKSDSSTVGCLDPKAVREPFDHPASFGMLSAVQMAMWFVSLLFGGKIPECLWRPAVWGGSVWPLRNQARSRKRKAKREG